LQLTHPTHFFEGKRILSKVKNLRWNYEELRLLPFENTNQLRVGKYYLQKLLNEGNEYSNFRPYLTVNIQKLEAIEFWDSLKTKFYPSQSDEERILILKVIIILY